MIQIERQLKNMSSHEILVAHERMVEKVKRIIADLGGPVQDEDRITKLRRLRTKYAYVENELGSRGVTMKQRVTALVDLRVGLI